MGPPEYEYRMSHLCPSDSIDHGQASRLSMQLWGCIRKARHPGANCSLLFAN